MPGTIVAQTRVLSSRATPGTTSSWLWTGHPCCPCCGRSPICRGRSPCYVPFAPKAGDRPRLTDWLDGAASAIARVLDGEIAAPGRGTDRAVNDRERPRMLTPSPGRGHLERDRQDPVREPDFHFPQPALRGTRLHVISATADTPDARATGSPPGRCLAARQRPVRRPPRRVGNGALGQGPELSRALRRGLRERRLHPGCVIVLAVNGGPRLLTP
jgi:hypothetical protein